MPPKTSLLSTKAPAWNAGEALAALLAGGSLTREDAIRSVMAKARFMSRDDLARSAFASGWISRRDLGALALPTIAATIESKLRQLAGLPPVVPPHFALVGANQRPTKKESGG